MLGKISGISGLKESVEARLSAIESRIEAGEKKIDALLSSFDSLLKQLSEARELKQDYVEKFSKDLARIMELQDEFEKSLRMFSQNNAKLFDTIYSRLNKEIDDRTLPLKSAVQQISLVAPDAKKLAESLEAGNKAISSLSSVASAIKKEDFELKTYAKELLKMDSEKLRLMKEIESLKKIIAFERRNKR